MLLGIAACVCHAHRVCKPGTLCAVATPLPVCKATAPVPKPRPTLPCIHEAYVALDNVLYAMDLKTGRTRDMSKLGTADPDHGINAMGYNPKDRYLYGTQQSRLMRIFADGSTEEVLGLPFAPNMGDFDQYGRYWCSSGGKTWASVDLDPGSKNYKQVMSGRSTFPDPKKDWAITADWAHTPVDKDHMYGIGVSKQPGDEHPTLVRWSLATKAWEKIYTARHLSKSHTFGAVMATSDGIVYGLENMSGNIVRFNLYDHARTTEVRGGPVSASKSRQIDGTRCFLLPDSP